MLFVILSKILKWNQKLRSIYDLSLNKKNIKQ